MKISAGSWQNQSPGRTDSNADTVDSRLKELEKTQIADKQKNASFNPASSQASQGGAGRMKSTLPDDQVGTLAIELANSQTKLDVQQVSAKALRALANLKMCCVSCEEKDKKKALQMIRRMEKLLKRAHTKMRCLTKEEQLERRQRKAEKKEQERKAKELRDELRSRRRKRSRDEWNYALKESTRQSDSSDGLPLPVPGAGASVSPPSGIPITADASIGTDIAASPAGESVSLDVTA